LKLGIGAAVIAVALLAQFYPKKFPQNREFLLGCIALARSVFTTSSSPTISRSSGADGE
jgi:hypothetical protein